MRLHFEEGERELIRARLGLADDANDEAIAQAVATWVQEDPEANDNEGNDGSSRESGDSGNDDGNDDDIDASGDTVVVDVSEFQRLKRQEKRASAIEAAERIRDRDEMVEEAIADGKFSPGRRQHYKDRYDSDPDGTKRLIARLQKNTVPLEARGADEPTDDVDAQAYPQEWLQQGDVHNGTVREGRQNRRSRVTQEAGD